MEEKSEIGLASDEGNGLEDGVKNFDFEAGACADAPGGGDELYGRPTWTWMLSPAACTMMLWWPAGEADWLAIEIVLRG
jgi:hypothetical protein